MFRTLKDFQDDHQSIEGEISARDLQVATVAILCELAHADNDFEASELTEIVRVMNSEFDLTDVEIGELVEISEYLRVNSKKVEDYFTLVNKHFGADHKIELLRLMWLVIGADGVADKAESDLAVVTRKRLGLTMEQAVGARVLAQQSTALPIGRKIEE